MQNTSSKSSLNKVTNVKIFCTNTECQIVNEELINLRQQVSDLRETITSLENIIQLKEIQLENMQRNNERLSVELKKQQKCVRSMKQQLDDERFFYQREKDYFNSEIQRYKTKCVNGGSRFHQKRKELEIERESLEEENKSLKDELIEKAETTCNLCIKLLRMKYAKDSLRKKFDQLLQDHLRVMADMMEKLDEDREELNIIVSEKFQEPLPLSKAKFLQVVQRNARLVYENATLKVQIQHLTLNIEKLKCYTQKPKPINVDAKIIEKLIEKSKKRPGKEYAKWFPSRLYENETDKSTSLSQLLNLIDFTDYTEAVGLVSKIHLHDLKQHTNTDLHEFRGNETWETRTERAQSAPDIRLPETESGYTIREESSINLRDASTNT